MPTSITILGRKIPIKYVSEKEMHEIHPHAQGLWLPWMNTIYICKEAPREIQKTILLHEAGHALKTIVGLDQVISNELQEIVVQSFASLFLDLLKQKRFFK